MAEKFAQGVPEHEFSTAELQGYLLTCKKEPEQAVEGVSGWVMQERKDRADREVREAERKAKRDANQLQGSLGSLARLGIVTPSTNTTAAAAATTTTVGQQVLGSVQEPTVTASPSTPIFNTAAIEEEATRHVAGRLQGVAPNDNHHESPGHHKLMVNGTTTDSGSITPPRIIY